MTLKFMFAVLILSTITSIFVWTRKHNLPAFTDDNCIRAIVGEYAVENDYHGMKLIAHAIRNRKTLHGVYGFSAKHADHEPKEIWENASLAWFDSLNEFDPLHGASEWLSANDRKTHRQPRGMVLVTTYSGICFYKKLTR